MHTATRVAAAVTGALLVAGVGTAAQAAPVQQDAQGPEGSRITLCNSRQEKAAVADTWRDWQEGRQRMLAPGECITLAGSKNHENWGYSRFGAREDAVADTLGGDPDRQRMVYSTEVDAGVYLGDGFWLSARNPVADGCWIALTRFGDGRQQPAVRDTSKTFRYAQSNNRPRTALRVGWRVVDVTWDKTHSGYKNWTAYLR